MKKKTTPKQPKPKKVVVKPLSDGCGKEPIGNGGTPNGHWECNGSVWEWVPEIG